MDQARLRYATIPADQFDTTARWIYVTALAAGVEKCYSGVEKMLVRIAREIDQHVPDGQDWHVTLLRRMAMPVPERRPPVIREPAFDLLNQPRGFRHRVRNSYSETLNLNLVLGNTEKMTKAVAAFKEDLDLFRRNLEAPAND